MIQIFFVPGMFGSMLEMSLRSFTDLDGTLHPSILDDGSCHSFKKQHHPLHASDVITDNASIKITTQIYPFKKLHLDGILKLYEQRFVQSSQNKKILVHAPDLEWAEINLLMQYYKLCDRNDPGSLEIFGGESNQHDIQKWNTDYRHWSEMQVWQYREWFSFFYPQWVQEWIQSQELVTADFLILTNQEIIEDTVGTINKVISFCGLNLLKSVQDFANNYRQKQQYILDEYNLIKQILDCTLSKKELSWSKLNVISEAILQNKFRQRGFEWKCDGMNNLPTTSSDLSNIIYSVKGSS